MNISSSNYFSVGASTNKGISGLASGMDTEGMVEKMLSGVQAQIDKQKGLQKQTEWKQGIYQDLISQINSFSAKYFDTSFGSSLLNNLTSADFFSSKISKVTGGDAVSIIGSGSSAMQGDMSIVVKQLASAASVSGKDIGAGKSTVTGAKIDADFLEKKFGNKIDLTRTTTTYDEVADPAHENPIISTEDFTIDFSGATTQEEITQKISDALGSTVSVNFSNGVLSFKGEKDQTFTVKDTSSELMLQKLGISNAVGRDMAQVFGNTAVNMDKKPSATFTVTFDGVSKVITMDDLRDASGDVTANSMQKALATQLEKAFGKYVGVKLTTDNKLKLTMDVPAGEKGHQLTITGNEAARLGFENGASNTINSYTKLSALGCSPGTDIGADGNPAYIFKINGQKFTLGADQTVGDLMAAVNKSDAGVSLGFSALEGQFTMSSTRTGSKYNITAKDATSSNLITTLFGKPAEAQGKDALIEINGVETSRDSNTFTVDGITLKLDKESGKDSSDVYVKTTIGTVQDSDKIVTGIKGFVDDYNALVEKIHKYLKEDASYRDYKPLTDAQKKDMSESEIKDWEKKAQEGLLRNDPTLSGFLQSMRGILYMKPDSADLALYDIGIETTAGILDQYGKLSIDETKLRNALSNDAAAVTNLFTARDYTAKDNDGTKQGIGHLLNKTLTDYAKVTSGSPGLLVSMAGDKDSSTYKTQNDMYKSLQRIKDRIKDLQTKYERDRQRYWNQFNSMETSLANLNAQSSMFSQQFSGGY